MDEKSKAENAGINPKYWEATAEELERRRVDWFSEEFKIWGLPETLSWIAYRDLAGVRSIRRDDLRPARWYQDSASELCDPACEKTLLKALIDGRVTLARKGKRVSQEELLCVASVWDLSDARIRRDDVLALWPANSIMQQAAIKSDGAQSQSSSKSKGGRPPTVSWEVVEEEVFRLIMLHGDFTHDDPDWNTRARLEEKIEEFCRKKFGREPGRTTIQSHLPQMIERSLAKKMQNPET